MDILSSHLDARPVHIADGSWRLDFALDFESGSSGEAVVCTDLHGAREDFPIEVRKGANHIERSISVEDPTLWYPAGLGFPRLYPFSVSVGGRQEDRHIGFRTAEERDGWLYINGRRMFIKACCPDKPIDGRRCEGILKGIADCNMNMVVLDGEIPQAVYDAADRTGVLAVSRSGMQGSSPSSVSISSLPQMPEKIDADEWTLERTYKHPQSADRIGYLPQLMEAVEAERFTARKRIEGAAGVMIPLTVSEDGRWSLLQYAARQFFSPLFPLLIMRGSSLLVYIVNDSDKELETELSVKLRTFSGQKKFTREFTLTAPAESVTLSEAIELGRVMRDDCFCYAKLATKGMLRERVMLLDSPRRSRYLRSGLRTECTKAGPRSVNVKLTTENPSFDAYLETDVPGTFSDNLISVRPTAEKNVIFSSEEEVDLDRFISSLRIADLSI